MLKDSRKTLEMKGFAALQHDYREYDWGLDAFNAISF